MFRTLERLIRWCLLCGLSVPLLPARSVDLSVIVSSPGEIRLRIPETPGEWLRIERSEDLIRWGIERDSASGPLDMPLHRPQAPLAFFRASPVEVPEGPYIVAVIGDSTAAGDFPERDPPRVFGWAHSLPDYTEGPDTTILLTTAEPAISSRTFFTSPYRHVEVLTRVRPQMVLVQLGQIDEFTPLVELKATTLDQYRVNLGRIVDMLRGIDAAPVLVTLLPFREGGTWNNGNPVTDDEIARQLARTRVVREVAAERGVWLVDLHRMLGDHFRSLSPEARDRLGAFDAHHLSLEGASFVADMALDALPPHFRETFFGRSRDRGVSMQSQGVTD